MMIAFQWYAAVLGLWWNCAVRKMFCIKKSIWTLQFLSNFEKTKEFHSRYTFRCYRKNIDSFHDKRETMKFWVSSKTDWEIRFRYSKRRYAYDNNRTATVVVKKCHVVRIETWSKSGEISIDSTGDRLLNFSHAVFHRTQKIAVIDFLRCHRAFWRSEQIS